MPRIRPEGGTIGVNNTPTTATATGMWTMQDVARNLRNSTWPLDAGAAEPYFNLNALLIHADSTNGKTNQTYIDSSTGARTITTLGEPYQGTFTPFSQTGWSNYFNGSTDYITLPNNMTAVGNGAYTLEGWFYPTTVAAAEIPIVKLFNATQTIELRIVSSKIQGRINNSATIVGGNTTITPNQWYHFALVKPTAGTSTAVLYINGVAEATTASDTTTYTAFTTPRIGANQTPSIYYTGWASSVRFLRGTGLYTGNFTPSTTPLTAITNTLFLTCQDNRFKENSTNGYALTISGTPVVESFSPFSPTGGYSTSSVGGSIYFDGSNDYLTVPGNADLTFNANFTIECFCYVPSSIVGGTILTIGNEATGRLIISFNGSRQLQIDIFNVITNAFTGGTFSLNSWNHFAFVRVGSTITAYINGVSVGTYTSSATLGNTTSFRIARDNGANHTKAYLSGINIVKGTALYTSAFTPPTAPITAHADTKLLLSGTNAGIIDLTSKNNLNTLASAVVSTAQSKFGGSSFFINDGDSNLATIPHNKLLNLDSGNFTIEFWVYLTQNASSYNFIISKGTSGAREWAVNVGPGTIRFYWSTNGSSTGDSSYSVTPASIPLSTWMHIAVVRSSTNLYIFKDGTQVGSTGTFTSMYVGTNVVNIGRFMDFTGIGHSMFGYIDDLRITKYARYTANFTPSTIAFADR